MNNITYAVSVDVNNPIIPYNVYVASVLDSNVRYLEVTLYENGNVIALSNEATATASLVTDDVLIDDSVECTISNNIISVPLEDLQRHGNLDVQVTVTEGTKVLAIPFPIQVRVTPNIAENAQIDENSLGSYAEVVHEIAEARGTYTTLHDAITAKLDGKLTVKPIPEGGYNDCTESNTLYYGYAGGYYVYVLPVVVTGSSNQSQYKLRADNGLIECRTRHYSNGAWGSWDNWTPVGREGNIADGAVTWAKLAAALQTAINAKAPASTAYTFDSTTTNVVYNVANPKTIYTNACVNGKSAFVLTTADNYYQIALCYDGSEYTRQLTGSGSTTYNPWLEGVIAEEVGDLKGAFNGMTTATAEDEGKALIAKTVQDGKVTEWEFTRVSTAVDMVQSQNLFDYETMWKDKTYITPSNGNESATNNYASSDFISVEPATEYTLSIATNTDVSNVYWNVIEYNSSKTRVASHSGFGAFTTSDNTAYIRFCLASNRGYNTDYGTINPGQHQYYIQFEKGAEATIPMPFGNLLRASEDVRYNNFAVYYDGNKDTRFVCPKGVYGLLQQYTDFTMTANDIWHTSSVYIYDRQDNQIAKCAFSALGILLPTVKSWAYGIITMTTVVMVTITKGINKYPMQIDYYPVVNKNDWTLSHKKRKKILFFGDSFTSINDYPKAVLSDTRPDDWYLYGQSGQPITNYPTRLSTLVQRITLSDYDTMIVTGGSNDFNLANSLENVATAMETFFQDVFTEAPEIEIVWFIPTYTYGYQSEASTGTDINRNGIHISEYAKTIKETCEKHSVKYYDAYCKSEINRWTVNTLTRDGLHPTTDTFYRIGHEIVKECL